MSLEVAIDSPGPAERRARLTGRLDTVTAPQLDAALGPALGAAEVTTLVFDLGRLSCVGVYLDVLEPGTVRICDSVTRLGSS